MAALLLHLWDLFYGGFKNGMNPANIVNGEAEQRYGYFCYSRLGVLRSLARNIETTMESRVEWLGS